MKELLFIILGIAALIGGGHFLVKASVSLALRLAVPKIVVGLTIVSFATSAPELIVSVQSALAGYPDMAVGNVVGSNIANLALVLAVTILLAPIDVERTFYYTDWPVMMAASVLLFVFIAFDKTLSAVEGGILFLGIIGFTWYLFRFQKPAVVDESPQDDIQYSWFKTIGFMLLGGIGLYFGAEWLILGAVGLAESVGISERVIAVTVVAVGTSIPELAASVIAVLKKEKAISLGNLVGSNIFNIFSVLGITSMIAPITVKDPQLLQIDIYWMLLFAFIMLPLVFIPKGLRLSFRDGLILLGLYGVFLYQTFT